MNKSFLFSIFLSLLLTLILASQKELRGELLRLKILHCHDGDTCTASNGAGFRYKLRLLGIDAPEVAHAQKKVSCSKGQAFGRESGEFINSEIKGKDVSVELRGHDVYRRYLALIWKVNVPKDLSNSINSKLVSEGLAHAYRWKGRAETWALEAEKQARNAKKGLWRDNLNENPSDFRKRCR